MREELAVKLRISHRGRVEQVAVLGQELCERAEDEATIVAEPRSVVRDALCIKGNIHQSGSGYDRAEEIYPSACRLYRKSTAKSTATTAA